MVKSAARTIDVLELLARSGDGLTTLQVAHHLDAPKSSVHMLISTLVARGVVTARRTPEGAVFTLGHKIFEIGQAYTRSVDLIRDGQETVRGLSAACGETVHLAALDGTDVVYLAKHEGTEQLRMVSAVGRRLPAHGTGVGKVLLAGLDDSRLLELYPDSRPLVALTPRTIVDPRELRATIDRVRERGVAEDSSESTLGLSCVAVPIYDCDGLVAALSASVPTVRFEDGRKDAFTGLLREYGDALSTRLGCLSYPATISRNTTRML